MDVAAIPDDGEFFRQMTLKLFEEVYRDGFLNGGRILEEDELDELTNDLDRVIAKGPDGFSGEEPQPVSFRDMGSDPDAANPTPVWQIVNVWEAAKSFEKLIYHPTIVKGISLLTGFGDLQVWHDQVQYKPSEVGGATGWHQDAPAWPSIEPMTPVSAWIPFDDADLDNGCMWMVPGSYKWGDQSGYLRSRPRGLKTVEEFPSIGEGFTPPGGEDGSEVKAVPCPVRRGEVHFHHSLTWHGSPMNPSNRKRRALAIHYMTSEARYTGREHIMEKFIEVKQGEPMSGAGSHFPIVCRDGIPVAKNK